MNTLIKEDVNRIIDNVNLTQLSGKKILITGASGLLGTYFVACLKQIGDVGIYTVSHSTEIEGTKHRSIDMATQMIKWDTTFDYIIHAIGYGQPGKFTINPTKTILLNTLSLLNLGMCVDSNTKLLFISSSEIYSGLHGLCNESQIGTANTDHPRSCYIEGKRCGEAIISVMRNEGINAKSARLALAYGPGTKKNDNRVLNEFIQHALCDKNIVVHGGGGNVRTYCYISDAVEMLWNILLFGTEPIYNVGGVDKITILELANFIGDQLNIPVNYEETNTLTVAPDEVQLDLSLYETEFNKKEFVSFDEGINNTIKYQKELYNV